MNAQMSFTRRPQIVSLKPSNRVGQQDSFRRDKQDQSEQPDKKNDKLSEIIYALTAAGLSMHVLRIYDSLDEKAKKDERICEYVCMARKKLIFPSHSQICSEAAYQARLVLCEQQREFALRVLGVEKPDAKDDNCLQAVKDKLAKSLKGEGTHVDVRRKFALFLRYIADAWRYQVNINSIRSSKSAGTDDAGTKNAREFYELAICCLIQDPQNLRKPAEHPGSFWEKFTQALRDRKQQIIEQPRVTSYLSGLVLNYSVFLGNIVTTDCPNEANHAQAFAEEARKFLLEHMDKLPEEEYRQVKSDVKKLDLKQ